MDIDKIVEELKEVCETCLLITDAEGCAGTINGDSFAAVADMIVEASFQNPDLAMIIVSAAGTIQATAVSVSITAAIAQAQISAEEE